MTIFITLSSLALRPLLSGALSSLTPSHGATIATTATSFLLERFTDQSQRLNTALQRSSERAWRALEVALAGESLWSWIDPADDRAFRHQVRAFLDATPLEGLSSHGAEFRQVCVRELRAARSTGLLGRGSVEPKELAHRTVEFARFTDPQGLLEAEWRALDGLAAEMEGGGHRTLAHFLRLRPSTDLPLLIVAVRYFFRRQVETDEALARSLAFAKLERLAEAQESAFAILDAALDQHARRLDELLTVALDVRSGVLDVRAELGRQGQQIQELGQAVLTALRQHQLEKRELRPHDSLSLRSDPERQLVRQLVLRFRKLPTELRQNLPALLNALGKLQVLAGDFEAAQHDFQDVAGLTHEAVAQAEARYHAYRAALERRKWDEAMSEFRLAVALDPVRFAPFPLDRHEPLRILGAGGFGVVFLCRHRFLNAPVVIKALLADDLDREVDQVFAEAQTLLQVSHPAVIRVTDCAYADAVNKRRPYLAMDYFDSVSLEEHVRQHGPLSADDALEVARQIAEGLQAAHARGILHRDVKPANVLVRKDASGWQVKLIDFGLAVRKQAIQNTITNADALSRTLAGSSIAGTIDYAAPEQMGKLPGVSVGPPADVYGFGKTCCYALFQTPTPRRQHWQQIAGPLGDLLDSCLAERPEDRPATIQVVCRQLAEMKSGATQVSVPPAPPRPEPVPLNNSSAPSPEELTPLTLREKIAQTVVALHEAETWAKKLTTAGGFICGIALGLAILFFVLFFGNGHDRDVAALLVLGCVSAGVALVPGPIVLIAALGFRRSARRHSGTLQRLARSAAETYSAAVPLGVEVTRWDQQAGWDLVRHLDEHHVRKGVKARLRFPGRWLQNEAFKVYLDGRLLGNSNTKTGFDFRVSTCVGTHQLHIKWDKEVPPLFQPFDLTKDGDWEVECKMPQANLLKVEVNYF